MFGRLCFAFETLLEGVHGLGDHMFRLHYYQKKDITSLTSITNTTADPCLSSHFRSIDLSLHQLNPYAFLLKSIPSLPAVRCISSKHATEIASNTHSVFVVARVVGKGGLRVANAPCKMRSSKRKNGVLKGYAFSGSNLCLRYVSKFQVNKVMSTVMQTQVQTQKQNRRSFLV